MNIDHTIRKVLLDGKTEPDFIDVFIRDWHWPSFNVADSALTVGIILFLFLNIKHDQET